MTSPKKPTTQQKHKIFVFLKFWSGSRRVLDWFPTGSLRFPDEFPTGARLVPDLLESTFKEVARRARHQCLCLAGGSWKLETKAAFEVAGS